MIEDGECVSSQAFLTTTLKWYHSLSSKDDTLFDEENFTRELKNAINGKTSANFKIFNIKKKINVCTGRKEGVSAIVEFNTPDECNDFLIQVCPVFNNGTLRAYAHTPELIHQRNYKTQLCWYYLRGRCSKGKMCTYAHSLDEIRTHNFPSSIPKPLDDKSGKEHVALINDTLSHRTKESSELPMQMCESNNSLVTILGSQNCAVKKAPRKISVKGSNYSGYEMQHSMRRDNGIYSSLERQDQRGNNRRDRSLSPKRCNRRESRGRYRSRSPGRRNSRESSGRDLSRSRERRDGREYQDRGHYLERRDGREFMDRGHYHERRDGREYQDRGHYLERRDGREFMDRGHYHERRDGREYQDRGHYLERRDGREFMDRGDYHERPDGCVYQDRGHSLQRRDGREHRYRAQSNYCEKHERSKDKYSVSPEYELFPRLPISEFWQPWQYVPCGQTYGPYGQHYGLYGQTSGLYGQTYGLYGQTSGQYGQTSGQYGQTSGQYGQTSGQYGQTSGQYGQPWQTQTAEHDSEYYNNSIPVSGAVVGDEQGMPPCTEQLAYVGSFLTDIRNGVDYRDSR